MAYTVSKLTDFSPEVLEKAAAELLSALQGESDLVDDLEGWKVFRDRWQARKNGIVTQVRESWLKTAPAEYRSDVGKTFNDVKRHIDERVDEIRQSAMRWEDEKEQGPSEESSTRTFSTAADAIKAIYQGKAVDITLPGTRRPIGAEHPIIKTMNEIVGVFRNLGYSVEEGPEIETDYYNFEALNFPPNHPARDTQDTLFVANQESKPQRDRLLLRTHTSPVQIRTMQKMKPPVRVVCPGKVHRNDAPDATHSPVFHQVEGLAVDTNVTFCDLKGTLDHAMKALFGSSVKTRFYPSFFPFTEPSADVQISCIFCGGKGYRDGGPCRNCKASGWIELLGCGMVDPNVFGFVDYDPKKVSGFAFGMGVERIAILKYGVDDIQLFFNGDVRFLEQFA